jgi:putative glutamine amidotransferase
MSRPVIGITMDNLDNTRASGRYEAATAYGQAVAGTGAAPVLLPHEMTCVEHYVLLCDGLILTGGVDPDTRAFGQPMHPKARPMDPTRQAFELALLEAVAGRPHYPVLGVCLGMQLMALHAGGELNQYLPDTLTKPEIHQKNYRHTVMIVAGDSALFTEPGGPGREADAAEETVASFHQQAVASAGRLRVVARAADGVIEAIDDPSRRFYGGVQWHPERGGEGALSAGVMRRLVAACRRQTSS